MDNAQKAIMIGVGIFITLLIIAAVMAIVNLGIGFMNTGTDRAEALRDAIVNSFSIFMDKNFWHFSQSNLIVYFPVKDPNTSYPKSRA